MLEFVYSVWNYIEFIAATVNHLAVVLNTLFAVCTWIGKLMVDCFSKSLIGIYSFVYSIVHGFTIMCEDFTYFLSDLENILSYSASLFNTAFDSTICFFSSSVNMLYIILYSIVNLKDNICCVCRDGMRALYDFLITLKGAIILIGNFFWTVITLIPAIIFYLVSIFVFFIHKSAEEIRTIVSSILNGLVTLCSETYLFIIDTPIESTCGLIVGFALMYLTHKYKITIISVSAKYFYQLSRSVQAVLFAAFVLMLNTIYKCVLKSKCAFCNLKRTVVQHLKKSDASPNSVVVSEANCPIERLCVVCKDSESNVVIIPCNHMCLCEGCSNYEVFRQYPASTCPVCRQKIFRLLKVYL